jgi:hypothetical protein
MEFPLNSLDRVRAHLTRICPGIVAEAIFIDKNSLTCGTIAAANRLIFVELTEKPQSIRWTCSNDREYHSSMNIPVQRDMSRKGAK